jgi:hypothetical protein
MVGMRIGRLAVEHDIHGMLIKTGQREPAPATSFLLH